MMVCCRGNYIEEIITTGAFGADLVPAQSAGLRSAKEIFARAKIVEPAVVVIISKCSENPFI